MKQIFLKRLDVVSSILSKVPRLLNNLVSKYNVGIKAIAWSHFKTFTETNVCHLFFKHQY